MTFTVDEIDLLMEGLSMLGGKDANDLLMSGMLGAVVMNDKESYSDMLEREREKYDEGELARKMTGEHIILIKAKLIRMKDAKLVEEAAEEIGNK